MIYQGKERYPVDTIDLHTSATPANWWRGKTVEQMRDEIDKWHKARGWRGIGYQFVVAPDGSYSTGRALTEIPAQVQGHNRGHIGICMVNVANHTSVKPFGVYHTDAQRETVLKLIASISELTTIQNIRGHNDYTDAKTCPGFKVIQTDWTPKPKGFWETLIAAVLSIFGRKANA